MKRAIALLLALTLDTAKRSRAASTLAANIANSCGDGCDLNDQEIRSAIQAAEQLEGDLLKDAISRVKSDMEAEG
jgi:hypothetical protein